MTSRVNGHEYRPDFATVRPVPCRKCGAPVVLGRAMSGDAVRTVLLDPTAETYLPSDVDGDMLAVMRSEAMGIHQCRPAGGGR